MPPPHVLEHVDHPETTQSIVQADVLHGCVNAGHARPPFSAGVVTVRVWVPPPHGREHVDHPETAQSTAQLDACESSVEHVEPP